MLQTMYVVLRNSTEYTEANILQYYTFKNIRFAAPPVGNLRWEKPAPPLQQAGVQDGKVGYQCNQALNGLLSCTSLL